MEFVCRGVTRCVQRVAGKPHAVRGSQPGTMGTLMTAGSSLNRGRYVPVTCASSAAVAPCPCMRPTGCAGRGHGALESCMLRVDTCNRLEWFQSTSTPSVARWG